MTGAVRTMLDIALRSGFRTVIAYTQLGNTRSTAVLARLGFTHSPIPTNDGRILHRYPGPT
jgi:RimJ/RimL family protein N-acetyltransferase